MSAFSQSSLQKAIYEALSADTTLSGMIEGIYDHVPERSVFPYLTLGEATTRDWSSQTTAGARLLLALHVFSRERGRKEISAIMDRLHTLLHDAELTVEGQQLVLLRFDGSDILQEPDGLTLHGVFRLRALTHAS